MIAPKRKPRNVGKRLSRRTMILSGAQAGFAGLLGLRLYYLQIDQAEEYRLLAEENRINIALLAPARGLIYDRKGVLIAGNAQNYRVVIVREQAGDVRTVLQRLAQIIPLSTEEQEKTIAEIRRRSGFVPVMVKTNLSWAEISAVSANAPALPGVTPEVGNSRRYPMGADFAHVVGYVGAVSDADLQNPDDQDPLLQIPKFQIGKTGIERNIDRPLRGLAGSRRIEVNAVGRVMRELDRRDGVQGADVQLTIDHSLQNYLLARLDGQSASAVVMDIQNGDLLALGSTPSFDPNKFVDGISIDDYAALTENPLRPLPNKSVQGNYPPGSTFKMMVALAALEEGLIDPEERITCRGYLEVGKSRFHCWKRSGHGGMNLHDSLKNSCDVFYYELAQRVGIKKIGEMARRFGLGEHLELPVSGVSSGLIPTKDWKKRRKGKPWLIGDTVNAAIGQGFVLATPLQLATMTARIASGRGVLPRLISAMDGEKLPTAQAGLLGIATSSLRAVREGMFAVSNVRGGTAYRTRIADKSLAMAGKTGTSQVRRITAEERRAGVTRNADLPRERRDHALFVGYAPFDNPRFSVSVVVEHGGGGSTAAAPIARDIMLQALHGGLPPLDAYPASQRVRIKNQRKELKLRPPGKPATGNGRA